jgi:hypothetical protein
MMSFVFTFLACMCVARLADRAGYTDFWPNLGITVTISILFLIANSLK